MQRDVIVNDTFGNATVRITRQVINGELAFLQVTVDRGDMPGQFIYFTLKTQFEVDELINAISELAKHNPYKGV